MAEMSDLDVLIYTCVMCLVGGGFFITMIILIGRGFRKTIYRETELLRKSKEKEIELMQAQIDYYNSLKEKGQNNINNENW